MVTIQAAVFVQIEGNDVGKGKAFLFMHANQFRVKRQRSGARGKAETTFLPSAARVRINSATSPAKALAASWGVSKVSTFITRPILLRFRAFSTEIVPE